MPLAVSNTFVQDTPIISADMNENFDDVETYANTLVTVTDLADLPFGYITQTALTANSATFTSIADISGFSATWTATSTRRYKLSLHGHISSSVAGDWARLAITDASNVVQVDSKCELPVINEEQSVDAFVVVSGITGSVTYKVRGERLSGTGNIMVEAAATSPAILLVEDIGAV
jgi:hypothetical protein